MMEKERKKEESRKCLRRYKYDNGASNLKERRDVKIRDVMNCGKVVEAMARKQKEK